MLPLEPIDRPEATYIADACLSFLAPFVGLVLVFVIGAKKDGGLWPTPTYFAPSVQYYDYNGNGGYDGQSVTQQSYAQQYDTPGQYAQQQLQANCAYGPTEMEQPDTRHEIGSNSAPLQVQYVELGNSAPASELHAQTTMPYKAWSPN